MALSSWMQGTSAVPVNIIHALLLYGAWAERVGAEDEPSACVAFRRAAGCSPADARDPARDAQCDVVVRSDWAGFCECAHEFTTGDVACGHDEFTCAAACADRWRAMQGQGGAGEGATAAGADAEAAGAERTVGDADSELERLYQRGKQFYVVGNIELALRHYREALRQDPDHKASKADYKKLKKLQKAMTEAEAKLPRTVEGGRQVQLEQRENAIVALKYLDDALAVAPPAVYRAELYAHLCKCHTTLKEASKALASCAEHKRLDGASSGSRLYMAEAHILNEQFDEATHEYNAIREVDESSKEAREGLQLIDKLKRRALQVDHYKILGVGRSATEREIKRAYHKAAVRYHPDKYVAKNDADAAAADAKFKEIARAYEVLGDEELRRKYDLGEDPDDQQRPGQPRGGGHFRPMHHGGQRVHVHFG